MAVGNNRTDGNLQVTGHLVAGSMSIPPSTLRDAGVHPDAAISASKLVHALRVGCRQASGTAVVARTEIVYTALAATTVSLGRVVVDAAPIGDATCTIDVEKGSVAGAWASILDSAVEIDSGADDRSATAMTITSASLAAGEHLRVVVTKNDGTGTQAQGLAVELELLAGTG